MNASDRRKWASARTLADLGELTAQWLEDGIESNPCYRGRPDPETEPLIPVLARLNRAGFVTIASQPGESGLGHDRAYWRKRAAVEGFTDRWPALAIANAARAAGLHPIVHSPATRPRWRFRLDDEMPVTWRGTEEYTWFGQQLPRREIRSSAVGWGTCHRSAVKALCRAWQVTVIDLEWGRAGLLWEVLAAALEVTESEARP
jgi:hypothetical protein